MTKKLDANYRENETKFNKLEVPTPGLSEVGKVLMVGEDGKLMYGEGGGSGGKSIGNYVKQAYIESLEELQKFFKDRPFQNVQDYYKYVQCIIYEYEGYDISTSAFFVTNNVSPRDGVLYFEGSARILSYPSVYQNKLTLYDGDIDFETGKVTTTKIEVTADGVTETVMSPLDIEYPVRIYYNVFDEIVNPTIEIYNISSDEISVDVYVNDNIVDNVVISGNGSASKIISAKTGDIIKVSTNGYDSQLIEVYMKTIDNKLVFEYNTTFNNKWSDAIWY